MSRDQFTLATSLGLVNGDQFDLENKGRTPRNRSRYTPLPVTEFWRNGEAVFRTFLHQLKAFGPTRNHPIQREGCGRSALYRTVELRSVDQGPDVVNGDAAGNDRRGSIAFL